MYEQHKREDCNTEAQCTAEGFMLLPFIVEAHSGAFGADAKKLLRQMGHRFASSSGGNVGSKVSELAMRIQATLHRETARAVLRRWSHRLEGLPAGFSMQDSLFQISVICWWVFGWYHGLDTAITWGGLRA